MKMLHYSMKFELTKFIRETSGPLLILSAGMPRSGSTWMYNAARLLLLNLELTRSITGYCWIDDLPHIEKKRILLIKIHNFSDDLLRLDLPKIVLYSYRDIRDTLASAKRKWEREPTLEAADSYIRNDIAWRGCADFVMRYEVMIRDPRSTLVELAKALSIHDVDFDYVIAQIEELRYESPGRKNDVYHMENLLHKGHITDGRHGSWREALDKTFLEQLESRYRDWFKANDY